MKIIHITAVANGWIVKSEQGYMGGDAGKADEMYVFRDIKELQGKLPEILGMETKPEPNKFTIIEGVGKFPNPDHAMYEAFQKVCAVCKGSGNVDSNLGSNCREKCWNCLGSGRIMDVPYIKPVPEGPKNL